MWDGIAGGANQRDVVIEAGNAGVDAEKKCRSLVDAITDVGIMNGVTCERETLGDEGFLELMEDRVSIE
jgi:hypothetical protein